MKDPRDNGTAVHWPDLFWHVLSHDVFSQLPWSERAEAIFQKRGKSKEECKAAFLRSHGPAICTASVPHGPLIKAREGYDGHILIHYLFPLSLSSGPTHRRSSFFPLLSIIPSAALWHSLFHPFNWFMSGALLVTDVKRWRLLRCFHYSDQVYFVYMSLNFNSGSLM